MVKQCIAAASRPAAVHARLPILEKDMPQPILHSLGRILPTEHESKENVRARSAVLRVAERTSTSLPPQQGASIGRASCRERVCMVVENLVVVVLFNNKQHRIKKKASI